MINGRRQIAVYLTQEQYEEWKQSGMKASFVFIRGMKATDIIKEDNEKDLLISQLQKSVITLNNKLFEIQDHAEKLEKANEGLQAENLELRKRSNYPQ